MRPLDGIRVLDLTRVVSGPFCTMQLGDLGAEIIKVEEPEHGDDSRAFGPPFLATESAYFLSVNRNKRSIAIDLKTTEGKGLLLALVAKCDVLIENFRPGTMERLGLDEASLACANASLIRCSITGFGSTGPDAQRPGYDLIVQGESGIMDVTGDPAGPPTKVGASIGDLVAGLYATQGILTSLIERDRRGTAAAIRVDVSMLDSLASLLTFNAGIYFATGQSPSRMGNAHPTIAPYETFRVSDGWINLGVANDKFWRQFCTAVGADELMADPRFERAPDRVKHRAELVPRVEAILAANSKSHWTGLLARVGVPCGQIRTVGEVCTAEQLTSRGMILTLSHPVAGSVRSIASPVRFDDAEPTGNVAPPTLGQHTREILSGLLGLDDKAIAHLAQQRVVRLGEMETRIG